VAKIAPDTEHGFAEGVDECERAHREKLLPWTARGKACGSGGA